ncbi:MAG: hypothetical protein BKP49_04070 [Treponema sp. CETP13]|nr:MAG: hypothetical protein BKP49_04070 [Treponema sp. CETP13]
MEQKGILWIVAAVGIFLLAVLGGALILYSPAKENKSVVSSLEPKTWNQEQTNTQNTVESLQDLNKSQPSLSEQTNSVTKTIDTENASETDTESKPINTKDLTVYSSNTTVIANDGTTLTNFNTKEPTTKQNVTENATSVTQTTNTPGSTTIDLSNKQEQDTQKTENSSTKKIVVVKKEEPKQTTVKSQVTSSSVTKKAETKTPVKKVVNSFWVQAASYTNKINAEKARDTLLAEEIPGEVFTYSSKDGTTYYRLRVGPYTTKSEAEYWNKRIKLVDEFAKTQSYVTNSAIPSSN